MLEQVSLHKYVWKWWLDWQMSCTCRNRTSPQHSHRVYLEWWYEFHEDLLCACERTHCIDTPTQSASSVSWCLTRFNWSTGWHRCSATNSKVASHIPTQVTVLLCFHLRCYYLWLVLRRLASGYVDQRGLCMCLAVPWPQCSQQKLNVCQRIRVSPAHAKAAHLY